MIITSYKANQHGSQPMKKDLKANQAREKINGSKYLAS